MSDENVAVSTDTSVGKEVAATTESNAVQSDMRNPKVMSLPVRIMVSVGKAEMTVEQLLNLTPEAVIDLDAQVDDPAEIFVGDRLVARGELVESDGKDGAIAIRLVEVCDAAA
jgi:flagellar motor switch protein FliN